jgi:amino acid adenylation domain-containing protein/non-ribosomal peptide synthase protein (TIGR01720 family)
MKNMPKTDEQIAQLSPEELQILADRLLTNRKPNTEVQIMPCQPRPRPLPISHSQEALLLLDRLGIGAVYNESMALRLEGAWSVPALRESLGKLVERHEILRTRIVVTSEGQGAQIIDPAGRLNLDIADLSSLSADQQAHEVRRRMQDELLRRFDLASGPLFRVALLRLSDVEYVLCITAHHIIWDLWSLGVLLKELGILYAGCVSGRQAQLPPLEVQYADYVLWQREWLQSGVLEKQLKYWKAQLAEAPGLLELPTDKPRPMQPSFRGAHRWFHVSNETSSALNQLGRHQNATFYMVLLAAFQILLSRWSGQRDIVVGSPIAGRKRRPTEQLIGFFVNMLALRTNLSGDPTFPELLARVKEVVLGAFDHPDVPFEKLVSELQPERHLSRQALFQVTFALQNQGHQLMHLPGLKMTPIELHHQTAKFDLSVEFFETATGLASRMEYSTDLFDASTIERFTSNFKTLLEGIAIDPNRRVSELPLLTKAERTQLLTEWNQTAVEYPKHRCVHELFEEQVVVSGNAVAVTSNRQDLTYAELNARSNQVAHWLKRHGIRAGSLVGLCVERSPEMLVAMLGILKAGGAYVPIDSEYPDTRVRYILEDTKLETVLTQERLLERLSRLKSGVRCDALESPDLMHESRENPNIPSDAENLAYVIYTSGSTAEPKGVCATHKNISRLVKNTNYVTIRASDNIAQLSNVSFDAATFEIWGALLNGARITIVAKSDALAPAQFAQQLTQSSVTIMFLTTALFNQYVRECPEMFGSLRYLLFGGEAADSNAVRAALATRSPGHLLNAYGPTEATTFASWYPVTEVRENAMTVPIGRPISNTELYVLDENLEPIPVGVVGELCVGGDGLARGYLGRPELTAERFVPNPFGVPGTRMYRTGDLVRYRPDGDLEFVGRNDYQAKIRGFRIEPGEIEATLLKMPSIRECVVVAYTLGERKQLVAYVVQNGSEEFDAHLVREQLIKSLPDYMVPTVFVPIKRLPLNINGKVDRHALPAPDIRGQIERGYVAPQNATEECLTTIFAGVLKLERVGVHDNFFEIGGDSIVALQIAARLTKAGLRVTVRDLFEQQTAAKLAAVADMASDSPAAPMSLENSCAFGEATPGEAMDAEQAVVEGEVPLTPIQHKVMKCLGNNFHLNVPVFVWVCQQTVSIEFMNQALRQVLIHHDALRLQLRPSPAGWQQWNEGLDCLPEEGICEQVSLSGLPSEKRDSELLQLAEKLSSSIDLSAPPLLRAALVDRGPNQPQQLLLAAHHLAIDPVSVSILMEDLQTAYEQTKRGVSIRLPAKTTSYKAWAERLARYASSDAMATEKQYWQALPWEKGRPLPVDHADGRAKPRASMSAQEVSATLDCADTQALLQVQRKYGVLLEDLLLTALAEVLGDWTCHPVVSINLMHNGRIPLTEHTDLSRTVGWFSSEFPVVLDTTSVIDCGHRLQMVKEHMRKIPNYGVGYGILRHLSGVDGLAAVSAPEIRLNHLGSTGVATEGALFQRHSEGFGQGNPLDCLIELRTCLHGGSLNMHWLYDEGIHTQTTLQKLASCFVAALRQFIAVQKAATA